MNWPSPSVPDLALFKDESAQVLPWMVLLVAIFLGFAGLTIDLSHAYVVQHELQASTDAAALAGGAALAVSGTTTSAVQNTAQAYSSYSTQAIIGANASGMLPSVTFTATPKCYNALIAQHMACIGAFSGSTGYNAIQVTQTSTINTFFIQALKVLSAKPMTSMTISTTSTASMKGAGSQYNVAILIDTTNSMGQTDTDKNCNNKRITCALAGVQTLLQSLTPCTVAGGSTCTGYDNVSIFTFPNVTANTAQNDYKCNGKTPTIVNYYTPQAGGTWSAPNGNNPTYQITGFLSDYSATNSPGGALSTSSDLTITAGGAPSCNNGLQTPGGDGTYFAGAIYAALSALNAEQALNPGSLNALVVLSDGEAGGSSDNKITASSPYTQLTTTGLYPSAKDQCQQAITAAQSASATTTVYSVAYGASNSTSDCPSDSPAITPCNTMKGVATSLTYFYSDAGASSAPGQCIAPDTPGAGLGAIFSSIASSLQSARLIPNNTT